MNMCTQYPDIEVLPEVFSVFPDLQVFAILVNGYDEAIRRVDIDEVHAASCDVGSAMGVASLSELPAISRWRDVYRTMGLKPHIYHASIEALLLRARRGWRRWQTGRKHVDYYNGFSIRSYAPLGGYDLDKLGDRSLQLRMLDPEEDRFNPLGGQSEMFPLKPDIAVYAVDNNIACWGLNHHDSRDYCVTKTTRQALFLSEANSIVQVDASLAAMDAMRLSLSSLGAVCLPCMRYSRRHPRGVRFSP
jgi:DNA/RNA-binding domain of Phe-tRNA-synthetase-like protein